jgi:serine/threonine-protein kinase
MRCPDCQSDAPASSRFCPACGAGLSAASDGVTIDAPGSVTRAFLQAETGRPSAAPPPPRPSALPPLSSTSSSSFHGAFSPGQVLAARYRIVALLGRGGMGEVYRADDLTLGVSVALKFLPAAISADPLKLERFRAEVRTTRQISHPNVCRVFDMGEADGRAFLSMEYIDGEDLSSLLRRIGSLPADKAVQIARQVCAGLAVAHDLGIIHRDLKPANIMLDGRGQARLMDFGVAGYAADLAARRDVTAGTPVYMAPEQLAGQGVSVRSDLYSLGLVLYEIFTGKSAWGERASSLAELRRLHESSRPPSATSLVADLDPAVERVIERCLDPDPANRPSSAIAVAAALPGGDPLAAALAAGETPSPEMVAQAGRVGAMPVRRALALLAMVVLAIAVFIGLNNRLSLLSIIRPEIPPAVMAAKARDILGQLGSGGKPAAESFAYLAPGNLLPHLHRAAEENGDREWPSRLADPFMPSLFFFYRASPERLQPAEIGQSFVGFDDPEQVLAGSARVVLDHHGRLIRFEAIPRRVHDDEAAASGPSNFEWEACFALAGLDKETFRESPPRWTPLMASDARAAWTGDLPTNPPVPIRVEAASERGRPVSFRVIYPWTAPDREVQNESMLATKIFNAIQLGLILSAIAGGAFLGWRNIRAGRHDRRGAAAVALFVLFSTWAGVALGCDSPASIFSFDVFLNPLARALWLAMMCWMFYTAFEPAVRRLWPKAIISWTRLVGGRLRDPLVGGDVLIGVAAGLTLILLIRVNFALPGWLGAVPAVRSLGVLDALRGPRAILSTLCAGAGSAITIGMLFAMLLIGLRVVFRRNGLTIAAFAFVLFVMQSFAFDVYPPALPLCALIAGLLTFLLVRIGLLALMVCLFASNSIGLLPFTSDLSLWYSGQTFAMIAASLALALFGFFTALGGQRIFTKDLLAAPSA